VVPGIELSGWNFRLPTGVYIPGAPAVASRSGRTNYVYEFLPDTDVTLSLFPMSGGTLVEPVTRTVPVANEFHSGIYEADSRTMFARLDLVQRMLKLDRAERIEQPDAPFVLDPQTGELVRAEVSGRGRRSRPRDNRARAGGRRRARRDGG
jgi:hypothetical protein